MFQRSMFFGRLLLIFAGSPRPHPSMTNHFAALPDEELLDLGEKIMAGEGPGAPSS